MTSLSHEGDLNRLSYSRVVRACRPEIFDESQAPKVTAPTPATDDRENLAQPSDRGRRNEVAELSFTALAQLLLRIFPIQNLGTSRGKLSLGLT